MATHRLGLTLFHPSWNPAPSQTRMYSFESQCQWLQERGQSLLGHVRRGRHWVVLTGCKPKARLFTVMDPDEPRRLFYSTDQVTEVLLYRVTVGNPKWREGMSYFP